MNIFSGSSASYSHTPRSAVSLQKRQVKGSDTVSSPLKLQDEITIDEICDMSEHIVGIAYLIGGVWKFHSREMPASVYDSVFVQSLGYQISSENEVRLIFIGY